MLLDGPYRSGLRRLHLALGSSRQRGWASVGWQVWPRADTGRSSRGRRGERSGRLFLAPPGWAVGWCGCGLRPTTTVLTEARAPSHKKADAPPLFPTSPCSMTPATVPTETLPSPPRLCLPPTINSTVSPSSSSLHSNIITTKTCF